VDLCVLPVHVLPVHPDRLDVHIREASHTRRIGPLE
jgi:hypothetical protein